jgi:polysaccharide biosynthesis protein PslH
MYNLTKGFSKHPEVDLSLFVFNTPKHAASDQDLKNEFGINQVTSVFIDTKIKLLDAFKYLFSAKSYNIERFNCVKLHQSLQLVLETQTFDVIHFEGLYASTLLETARKFAPKSKLVLRSHNIEFLIWKRRADQAVSKLKGLYLNDLAKKMKVYEDKIIPDFDAIIPITEVDEEYFIKSNAKRVFTSSTGLLLDNYQTTSTVDPMSVYHIGSLDWTPNQEALVWFFENVWSLVIKELPKAVFFLAGKNMPEWFKRYKSHNIKILGEVEDAIEFMSSHGIMIVPLLSGSGMRIKIIEGMACACPIVSTTIGAEGILCQDKENILLANSSSAFALALIDLLKDRSKSINLGEKARENVVLHYSNQAKTSELVAFYRNLMA